jgi:hypothetical protein
MPDESSIPARDVAAYVRDMTEELAGLALSVQLNSVAVALARAAEAAGAAVDAFDAVGRRFD